MTIEEWISRLDNEDADHLTQEEQLELKHFLIELNGYWMVLNAKKNKHKNEIKTSTWDEDAKMKMKSTSWSVKDGRK